MTRPMTFGEFAEAEERDFVRSAPATFAALVEGTEPSNPLADLRAQATSDAMRFGILHANIAFALKHLDGHPMALAALDISLDLIRERVPGLGDGK